MSVLRIVWLIGADGFQCCQNQPGNVSQNCAMYPGPVPSAIVTRVPRDTARVLLRFARSNVVD